MTAESTVRLTIVVVSYNTRNVLANCLEALHKDPPGISHQTIVVDNASNDGTIDLIQQRWPSVQIIQMGFNAGFAAANNAAIHASQSELVLLLNSDTVPTSTGIDNLVSALDTSPGVSAVGPRLINLQGQVELSFGRMISPWNEARQKLLIFGTTSRLPFFTGWLKQKTNTSHYPDWVSGACILVKRKAGNAVEWLDERYFLYTEDVDFCAALRAAGHKILFTPDAEVVHIGGQSGSNDPLKTRQLYRKSHLAFYAKHHPKWHATLQRLLSLRRQLPPSE
tara:strand:- start:384 stop:1223 length:840 start_codon:yes stop_codon:yes gene_type:complete